MQAAQPFVRKTSNPTDSTAMETERSSLLSFNESSITFADAGLDLGKVVRLGQNFVDGFPVAHSRSHPVSGDVLEAVADPDVHHAGLAQFFGKVIGDADAGFAMVNPEFANFLVGRGQSQTVGLGMGEEGGIEVAAQAPLLAEVHLFLEMLGFQLVPIRPLAVLENGIAGMEVYFLGAGAQLQHHVQIGHQFLGSSGPASSAGKPGRLSV